MNQPTTCKFCKKPIILTIDDAYAELGDPSKLIPMAACNRCADLRIRRRSIEEAIKRSVFPLLTPSKTREANEQKAREELIILTKKYTALIAEWTDAADPWWDIDIIDSIIANPAHWTSFLGQCWKMYQPASQVSAT